MGNHSANPGRGRQDRRRRLLQCEPLEDRRMLSLVAKQIRDIALLSSSDPQEFVDVGGITFFTAKKQNGDRQLWRTDGTGKGTRQISLGPGGRLDTFSSLQEAHLTNVNGILFFQAFNVQTGGELWKSDGTDAGTMLVKDIQPGDEQSDPSDLINVNGKLFFRASGQAYDTELWTSDGTAAGTVLVKAINPGVYGGSRPSNFANINGTLFFSAEQEETGREFWKSDGTAEGTVLVKDINVTRGDTVDRSAFPANFTEVVGVVFFTARDGIRGEELWKTDGTAAGTVLVKDIWPGSSFTHSDPGFLTNLNGTLLFKANDGTHGKELWKSDGTVAGTVLVKDIYPGATESYPVFMINANGTLFFRARHPATGGEVWKSDGTAAGTTLVKDIFPGEGSSSAGPFVNLNGTVIFGVFPPESGNAMWRTDGTADGTSLVANIYPGHMANANGTLFFSAFGDGEEPWRLVEVKDAPRVALGGSVTFVESRPAVTLAAGALVTDSDNPALTGGTLTVAITTNAVDASGDRLRIRHQGTGPDQIGLDGSSVIFRGQAIGTFAGGDGATPLVVTFNAQARVAGVQALARAITFSNVDANPPTALRSISFVLDDGADGTSAATKFVNVQRNGSAVVIEMGGHLAFREGDPPELIAPFARVAAPSGQSFAAGKLTVAIATLPSPDDRLAIRHQGTAAGEIGVAGRVISFGGVVIGNRTGGFGTTPLEVTLNAQANRAAVQALIRNITFRSVDLTPPPGIRQVRFRLAGGDVAGSPSVAKPLYILGVNAPPTLDLGGAIAYARESPALVLALAPDAKVTNFDSLNYAGGRLYVLIVGSRNFSTLALGAAFTVDRFNNIKRGNTVIGKQTQFGDFTGPLEFVFNANATSALVQELVRAIEFEVEGTPRAETCRVSFSLSDSATGASALEIKTVNVT